MAETLVIGFPRSDEDPLHWYLIDAQGHRVGTPQSGDWSECAAAAQRRRVVVLVPGEEVALMDAEIPTRKRQRILQAAPWVLEEHLAQDVESLHFAIGPRLENDRIRIGVIAKETMNRVVARLRESAIIPDALLPDFLAVPQEPEGWSLFVEGDRALVRTADCDGFTADLGTTPELLETMLPASTQESPEDTSPETYSQERPNRIRLVRPAAADGLWESLEKRFAIHGVSIEDLPYEGHPTEAFVPDISNIHALDLAQGEFQIRRDEDQWWWPWRPALALSAGLVLTLAVSEALHLHQMARDLERIEHRIDEVFLEALPDAETTRNARMRMEQRLEGLRDGGAGSGFLPVMKAATQGLGASGNGNLDSVSYRPGVLDLTVRVQSRGDLDGFRDAVEESGPFTVNIRSADSDNDEVRGQVEIRDQEDE